jgi:4a-hydroxytetrahydrobiopterin dehydratase
MSTVLWVERDGALQRSFGFSGPGAASEFVSRMKALADTMGHHPTWSVAGGTVAVRTTTHDAGDTVTAKDHALALAIDELFRTFGHNLPA